MSGGHEVDVGSPEKRKTLWVVLWLTNSWLFFALVPTTTST